MYTICFHEKRKEEENIWFNIYKKELNIITRKHGEKKIHYELYFWEEEILYIVVLLLRCIS